MSSDEIAARMAAQDAEDVGFIATQLERSLVELLDPLGQDLSNLHPESADDVEQVLTGLQRVAWAAKNLRGRQRGMEAKIG